MAPPSHEATTKAHLQRLLATACDLSARREQLSEEQAKAVLGGDAQVVLDQLYALNWEDGPAQERALGLCVQGKMHDLCTPEFVPEAEQALTKAVKLSPGLIEAWNALGASFWKKGDLSSARQCFTAAIKRERNKTSLQELSMLKRSIARGVGSAEEAAALSDESMQHAKEALALDVSDARSWYCMGSAYLSEYFQRKANDAGVLRLALKAYQNAEKGGEPSSLPDLHFNRAVVYAYLGEYQHALEGFSMAGQLDPSLPWMAEVESILTTVLKLSELVHAKGHLKAKRLHAITSTIAHNPPVTSSDMWNPGRAVGVQELQFGVNTGLCVQCKIVQGVSDKSAVPLHYLMVDAEGTFFALSVLGLADAAMKSTATLTLLEPVLKVTKCRWQSREAEYLCMRVEGPRQILVGGMMPMGFQAKPTLQTTIVS